MSAARGTLGNVPSRILASCLLAATLCGTGCQSAQPSAGKEATVDAPSQITVSSTAFKEGQPVPQRFTCDGDNKPPPLAWQGIPAGVAAVALVVDDPDAPRGNFVHWVVLDMPPDTTGIEAGSVPKGAVQAKNSAGRASYAGPCPPSGTHHYRFTVYALSRLTGLSDGADLDRALRAVSSDATAQGRLVGTYTR